MLRQINCLPAGLSLTFAWLLATCAGCGERRPLDVWRNTLEHYVEVEGHGDPAVLREMRDAAWRRTLRPARCVVGAIDLPGIGGRRRDVRGVLTGIAEVRGEPWYVFLVGVTELARSRPREIEDVRVVAGRFTGEQVDWRTGRSDRQNLRNYVKSRRGDPDEPIAFPGISDDFTLEVRQTLLTVRERSCGSTWQVDLDRSDDDTDEHIAEAAPVSASAPSP